MGALMHFWGNVKWGSHCGNSLEDPQSLNIKSPRAQAVLLWAQIQKQGMQGPEERFAHPHSHTAALFTIAQNDPLSDR